MKKNIFLICLAVFCSCTVIAQDYLFPIKVGKKFGYINAAGVMLIEPRFDRAYEFSEGLASVMIDNTVYYINEQGKIVLNLEGASFGYPFTEGVAFFLKNNLIGLIDKTGLILLPPQFKTAEPFKQGFARVTVKEQEAFYINKQGKNIFNTIYQDCYDFNEGYAVVRVWMENENNKKIKVKKIINSGGIVVSKLNEIVILGERVNNNLIFAKKNEKYIFCDPEGKKVIDLGNYYSFNGFYEGYATIYDELTQKYGVIDTNGKICIPIIYEGLGIFSEGLLEFQKDDKAGFIDLQQNIIIPNTFNAVLPFSHGMAIVNPRDGYDGGYVTKDGDIFLGKDYIK